MFTQNLKHCALWYEIGLSVWAQDSASREPSLRWIELY